MCPHSEGVRQLGEALARLIEEGAKAPTPNPFGAVVLVYCRECDCSHGSFFGPDGVTPREEEQHILSALRTAAATIEVRIIENDQEESSVKTRIHH